MQHMNVPRLTTIVFGSVSPCGQQFFGGPLYNCHHFWASSHYSPILMQKRLVWIIGVECLGTYSNHSTTQDQTKSQRKLWSNTQFHRLRLKFVFQSLGRKKKKGLEPLPRKAAETIGIANEISYAHFCRLDIVLVHLALQVCRKSPNRINTKKIWQNKIRNSFRTSVRPFRFTCYYYYYYFSDKKVSYSNQRRSIAGFMIAITAFVICDKDCMLKPAHIIHGNSQIFRTDHAQTHP